MHEDRYFGGRHAFPVVAEVDGASFHIVDGDDVTLDRRYLRGIVEESRIAHRDDRLRRDELDRRMLETHGQVDVPG